MIYPSFQVSDKYAVGTSEAMHYYLSAWDHASNLWSDWLDSTNGASLLSLPVCWRTINVRSYAKCQLFLCALQLLNGPVTSNYKSNCTTTQKAHTCNNISHAIILGLLNDCSNPFLMVSIDPPHHNISNRFGDMLQFC